MGASFCKRIENLKPPDVPWEVLQGEIASLNTDERCESDVYPGNIDIVTQGHFENILNKRGARCKKKHDHLNFILVKDLKLENIPKQFRSVTTLKFVESFSSRTVRLVVKYTSLNRPKKFGLDALKGTTNFRMGTGQIDIDTPYDASCVHDSESVFWVKTAAHMVMDDDEASATTVDFFFDDDLDRSDVIQGQGVSVLTVDIKRDIAIFTCRVASSTVAKCIKERMQEELLVNAGLKFGCIVSHPHGCAKRVTFGNVTSKTEIVTYVDEQDMWPLVLVYGQLSEIEYAMDDRKLLYYFLRDHLLPSFKGLTQFALPSYDSKLTLNALEEKHIVVQPEECDMELMETMWQNARADFIQTVRDKIETGELGLDQAETAMKDVISSKCEVIDLPDTLYDLVQEAAREVVDSPGIQLGIMGCQPAKHLKTMLYNIPTCPGSSGAPVIALDVNSTNLEGILGFHSMGTTKGNKSCYGATMFKARYAIPPDLDLMQPF